MTPRKTAASLLPLLMSLSVGAHAQGNDVQEGRGTPWPVTRLPFEPRILEGDANPICRVLVDAARSAFVSSNFYIDLYEFLPATAKVVTWAPLDPPFAMESELDKLSTASVDLDGDGRLEALLKRSNEWSWRGPTYSAFVYRDIDTMRSALAASANVDDFLQQGVHYLPAATSASRMSEGESWAWNDLFELDGGYYFLGQGNQFALFTASRTDGYRLEANGAATRVCRLEVMPAPPALTTYPGLASFVDILASIGRGGPDFGSGGFGTRHNGASRGAMIRAGARPWAMDVGRDNFERAEELIRDWSLRDPWSRREYLTYIEHRESALPLFSRFLGESFGMTQRAAAIYAEYSLKRLVVAHFVVPSSFPQFAREDGDVVLSCSREPIPRRTPTLPS